MLSVLRHHSETLPFCKAPRQSVIVTSIRSGQLNHLEMVVIKKKNPFGRGQESAMRSSMSILLWGNRCRIECRDLNRCLHLFPQPCYLQSLEGGKQRPLTGSWRSKYDESPQWDTIQPQIGEKLRRMPCGWGWRLKATRNTPVVKGQVL